jgi:hypothetical protein
MLYHAADNYWAMAESADRAAAAAQGHHAKQYWARIASKYRQLAAEHLKPSQPFCAGQKDLLIDRNGSAQRHFSLTDVHQQCQTSWYRLYLKSRTGDTVGRADLDAPDKEAAAIIAAAVFDACADVTCGYELWNGNKIVLCSKEPRMPLKLAEFEDYQQQIIVDTLIALHDGAWLVAESKKLLAEIVKLAGPSWRHLGSSTS